MITAMPYSGTTLAQATNAVRLFSTVLALAIIIWWTSSLWKILRQRDKHPDDTVRAAFVPLAGAVLSFQIRWFWPHFDQLMKDRLTFFAQCSMSMALLFAIYVVGSRTGALRLRRAIMIHVGMIVLCIGATSVLR